MPNLLHRLRTNVFQVIIADRITAVLHVAADAIQVFVESAGNPRLLATVPASDPVDVARRIANGEFDDDFRFEYSTNPEPSSNADLYFMRQIAIPSQLVIDSFTSEDPGATIESAREAQAFTLEERFDMYADRGW